MTERRIMTYCYPELTETIILPGGRELIIRAAGSPTRPARAHEVNVWWEDREVDPAPPPQPAY